MSACGKLDRKTPINFNMKKNILVCVFAIAALNVSAQSFEVSPKISLGTGRIHSKNLAKSFNQRNAIEKDVLQWDIKQKFGFTFGIGASFQYNINDKLSVFGEPTISFLKQKITIDYFENDIDGGGSGDRKTIVSEAKIKTSWFALPLLVQYGLGDNAFRISGGFEFLFVGEPKIESNEIKITETFSGGNLVDSKTEAAQISSVINEFNSPRTNFLIGIGTTFNVDDRNLYIDLRYHLPLSKSPLFTTDPVYHILAFKNNEVFDLWGKTDAELDAPQFRLDDYKLGTIDIVFRYVLFKK